MTRSQLVVKNLFRNRRRTILTTGSIAVSMFLFTVFIATYRYLGAPTETEATRRTLLVMPRISTTIPLPLSYRQRIARLKGVAMVSPFVTIDGMYGGTDEWLAGFATDPEVLLKLYSGVWRVPPDQRQAFIAEKTGLIVGRKLAEKHGWKLGDHIPLRNEGWHVTLDLVLRAIYTCEVDETLIGVHWQYLSEVWRQSDVAGAYLVIAESDQAATALGKIIDDTFRHEPMETRTMTMLQFALDFLGRLGNVKRILLMISGAVLFAILLVLANTMAMSIRERTTELAVLRVLGFRTGQIQGILAAESLTIALAGTTLACAAACGLFLLISGYRVGGWMPINIQLDLPSLALVLAVALATSFFSTFVPAYRASRVKIAEAMRFVG
ncbi:MAG: FtsX-like permease family protein [Terriglobia bacterium]|jgi:putative ABC transport system permease protein